MIVVHAAELTSCLRFLGDATFVEIGRLKSVIATSNRVINRPFAHLYKGYSAPTAKILATPTCLIQRPRIVTACDGLGRRVLD